MNLADWLQGDHEPSERLKAVETLCRAVSDSGRSLDLDPAHIQMSGDECRPSEGKAVPSGRYRPPEMAQGGPPVPQSQVFTVGVLCFEILSGRAFESRGGPLLRDLRPDLPRDVSDAVQACLEMDAEWRPKDLSYLLGQVEALAASAGGGSKGASRGGRPAAASSATPVNRARRGGPAPRPWPLLAFALLALAVSVGIDTPLGESFDYGPTLLGIEPLYLSRSFGAWHSVFGAVIYLPLGSYDDQSPANAALDRYGGALNGGLTWTPTPRWDLSLNLGYEFKGRNRHTQYRDGQQTGMSYGVAYRPFADMRWDVGVSGFYTVQVEDDRQSGHVIADRRVRKFAVGPKASFWFTPAASVILQFHREYETRNAPRGDLFWLMFSFPLGS
jgi:hypothetical protein